MTPAFATVLAFTLNGEIIRLQDYSPTITLLQYLQHSGRTGTKEGLRNYWSLGSEPRGGSLSCISHEAAQASSMRNAGNAQIDLSIG